MKHVCTAHYHYKVVCIYNVMRAKPSYFFIKDIWKWVLGEVASKSLQGWLSNVKHSST